MENRCTIETATDLSIDENLSSAALRLSSIFPTAPRSPSSTSPDVDPEQGSPGSATHHSTDLDEIRRELADLKTSHVALMDRCAAIEVENGILRDKVFALQSNKSIQVTQLTDEMGEKRKREKNVILSGLLAHAVLTIEPQLSGHWSPSARKPPWMTCTRSLASVRN